MSISPTHRKTRLLGSLGALLVLLAGTLAAAANIQNADRAQAQEPGQSRPNIVLIQTDDATLSQFYSTYVASDGVPRETMPRIGQMRRSGITFDRYYASYPLCCPSRATLLSGRYSHSNGVLGNRAPGGGWYAFRNNPIYRHNLAVWLQRAGYRTYHYGKFLNEYGGGNDNPWTESTVPPGWTDWQTTATDFSTRQFYGYTLNVNGSIQGPFGNQEYGQGVNQDDPACGPGAPLNGVCNYQTDAMTRRALDAIAASTPGGPFYLQLDYIAPHGDHRRPIGPEPAPRHYDTAVNTPLPRPPSFNEGNITDKPSFIRDQANFLDPTTIRQIRREWQKSLESLRSVDDGVGVITDALRAAGELDNTYIFVISDNGFFFGEHRLDRAKFLPYEPAVRVPLFVRGPGIKRGAVSREIVANTDIAPTILKLARAKATRSIDGRSLIRFWQDPRLRTRRPILLESFARATDVEGPPGEGSRNRPNRPQAGISISAPVENYLGIRLGPYKYVEYETGDRELYDLAKDPHELNNRFTYPRYRRVRDRLRYLLQRLENCNGPECRIVANKLPPVGFSRR